MGELVDLLRPTQLINLTYFTLGPIIMSSNVYNGLDRFDIVYVEIYTVCLSDVVSACLKLYKRFVKKLLTLRAS